MMINVPTIETERLVLRPHRLDDFDAYIDLWADEDVVRYISGVPSTREQTWSRLIRASGMWHHMGFGFLIIEEKQSGRLIGEAGFHEARREMSPSIEETLETGWVLLPSVHGRGYATEALTALIAWADCHFPGKEMTCIVSPENAASLRVAEKLGFREVARTDYHGEIILLSRQGIQPA
ncbi:RimJ/RimL family protein N-acetyltransferase [Rhizobium mongolense]|uniref:RimJ/RimL family protein N-acetyltransferase n=3 Tax=Rhizobium mongolense TaxID=57676 RepID=A0ABR6IKT6_9HYPH|nr:RimJ/RimL family protein N-acetyltransferase [Rhizobium mongolense]TVZ64501.1 RimJ/RimL family protein N-acetyltransferase [Rhizobium mongolense USDA 1844]